MKKYFITIVLAVAALPVLMIIFNKDNKEEMIKKAILEANYCETDNDCVDAGGKCPFGCYAYVNKDEVDRIRTMIQDHNSACVYGCVTCKGVECVEGKCEEVCE